MYDSDLGRGSLCPDCWVKCMALLIRENFMSEFSAWNYSVVTIFSCLKIHYNSYCTSKTISIWTILYLCNQLFERVTGVGGVFPLLSHTLNACASQSWARLPAGLPCGCWAHRLLLPAEACCA